MRALLATARPLPGERGRLGVAVLLSAGSTGAAIALLATSGYLISRAAQRPLIISLMVTITAVRAFGILRAALRYSERLASHDLALRQLARLRTGFYRRLAPLVPGDLRGRGRGDLLTRFVADVDTLQDANLRVLIPALVALLVILGASAAAAVMFGPAGVVVGGTLGITAILTSWASGAAAASSARQQAGARSHLTGQLVEAIDGSAELALAGRAADHVRQLADSDAVLARLGRRDALAGFVSSGLHSLLTGVGLIAVLLVAIDGVRSGSLPGVMLAAVVFLFLAAGEAVLPLPAAARRLQSCAAGASRVQEIGAQRPAILDPAMPEPTPGRGALALENITLRYEPEDDSTLDHVNLRLGPGEHVALVGPSGAGKTTLAELLVRFRDPDEGRITLDGIDIRRLTQEDVRRSVLLSDQDAHLFNTTIRENLLIGRHDAGDSDVWQALRMVELDDWARSLEHGLGTRVGQQGELVSGGQRQRLALARALLSDARFLILDEPVAHLDGPLAASVIRCLLEHTAGRGVLVITHATDALECFDRVLVLEHGRVQPAPRRTPSPSPLAAVPVLSGVSRPAHTG
ncbi:MAG TPA: thiol reductant ABC exporter subunit CydC [Solirubrobacteraceae bacterium]|nr:thiol reductant ABC exporter subunit CydC [Solirubrobacteraceae bacterium]